MNQEGKGIRFMKLTHNILIDKMPLDPVTNEIPLKNFYFDHLHSLLTSFDRREEVIFNYGKNTRHKYLSAVFEVLQ